MSVGLRARSPSRLLAQSKTMADVECLGLRARVLMETTPDDRIDQILPSNVRLCSVWRRRLAMSRVVA
jgi:hypothetical protein